MLDQKMQDTKTNISHHLHHQQQQQYHQHCQYQHPNSPNYQSSHCFQHHHRHFQQQQQQQQQQSEQHQSFRQNQQTQHSVSVLLHKTINSVVKTSRKFLFRVCEVTNVNAKKLKMFNLYGNLKNARQNSQEENNTIGHDRFSQIRPSRSSYRKRRKRTAKRTQSDARDEFEINTSSLPLTVSAKRELFRGRSYSSESNSDTEPNPERAPLVSAKLETLAKLIFNKNSTQDGGAANTSSINCSSVSNVNVVPCTTYGSTSPTRHNVRYQYTALDSGVLAPERNPRERAARERAHKVCQEWLEKSDGRYEIITHLDDIGSRHHKNWFLLSDSTIRTDRLMTLLSLPGDCVALEELPPSECPKGVLMELLGSLQHPYIYPVLDLEILETDLTRYACLVMPFNPRGSLKDLIYKSQWNDSWNRKYTKKATCLPISQVQRLGRQILEALLFLRERGITSHGHLHSGNVMLQNGVARLSGLENGLLGLNSRVNALWSRNVNDIANIDVICFGHLLFEMCAGYELNASLPTAGQLHLDLERYPQVADVLRMIFESPEGRYPTVEELVICDLFRNIDLREMRGPCVSKFQQGLSTSTLSLLNAVRRRQGASIGGSFSEGSSPCTPPSTPRRPRDLDTSSNISSSSDSDIELDDVIIISPSNFHYDSLNSPIHYCDNNDSIIQVDIHHQNHDESGSGGIIGKPDDRDFSGQQQQHQQQQQQKQQLQQIQSQNSLQPSAAYKNSKSRRMEYSSMRSGQNNLSNPSQDSAIGSFSSITDGELSRASSFKCQSMSSPIDEGVEDIILEPLDHDLHKPKSLTSAVSLKYIDSTSSTTSSPLHEYYSFKDNVSSSCASSRDASPHSRYTNHRSRSENRLRETCIHLEPPRVVINDQAQTKSIYTSSPIRKSSTTEVFSQKYRVSSFEDMSVATNKTNLKLVSAKGGRKVFHSLDDERRIESAFTPISSNPIPIKNVSTGNIMTAAVSGSPSRVLSSSHDDNLITEAMGSSNESHRCRDRFNLTPEPFLQKPTTSSSTSFTTRPDRQLFNLAKFKQNAFSDSIAMDFFSLARDEFDDEKENHDRKQTAGPVGGGKKQRELKLKQYSVKDDHSENSVSEALLQAAPSTSEIRKLFIVGLEGDRGPSIRSRKSGGHAEEKRPLLEGMEMSPISPNDAEEML